MGGYYDIDDILAESVEVPCRFNYDVPGLGYLEGAPGKQISKNSKVLLPIWLARILAIIGGSDDDDDGNENITNQMNTSMNESMISNSLVLPFIELLTPKFITNKIINAIKASPESLDLHAINSYFIEVWSKWINLFADKNLSLILQDLILKRSIEISNFASNIMTSVYSNNQFDHTAKNDFFAENAADDDAEYDVGNVNNNINNPFILTMDEYEKKVYRKTHNSYKDTKAWLYK
ncbi:hypothetical protein TPHA_0A00270 [Tetrapisispora phaffii CBS 4417]|uniref:DNA replication complex GINS protein PSF3 n=1 Tax=Tetrapisispora phaffii (strain ATCC 24235 / CBS 4417 / NBRC 1672 / NRRL Y-8282 / UCD 70-5) TaxID=1071381 RepID=G8BMI4_TETPH|nr:hypothetical protein TPHA_0A00270 [Tetrapisispora phaffii CBS 4417]CCE61112.1 hypothetical protein TPHA_0A00270 [Tetrapisispora phaffii CBS 4417]